MTVVSVHNHRDDQSKTSGGLAAVATKWDSDGTPYQWMSEAQTPGGLDRRIVELSSRLDDALVRIRNLENQVHNLQHRSNHAANQ